jgi:adenine-specific DNA-methyltransferase
MKKSGKLELTWVGKYDQPRVEPRILIADESKSYGEKNSGNMLIHGDNLIALKALEQDFTGKVKCIYIDPPYNTGSAFEHYDDGLENSEWLCMMRPRLEILRNLLSDDGSIWICIDDDEQAYLKVMCDEVFGRNCFITSIIWRNSDNSNNNALTFSIDHNYILVYGKNPNWRPIFLNDPDKRKHFKNPNNDPRGPWFDGNPVNNPGLRVNLQYDIKTPSGKTIHHPPNGWRWSWETIQEKIQTGEIRFSEDETRLIRRTYLNEMAGLPPSTLWTNLDVTGHTRKAKYELKKLFPDVPVTSLFDTPKPELLVNYVFQLSTEPNDLVLDSFLGSGTTAAVAHKMGRRWIGIELGEHAYTHCKARLDKVIDGEQGGISKAVGWQGGGGYTFYELAPSLLEKHPKLPVYQINKEYTFEMLCEAICKLEGFSYKPEGEMHGHSSENRFIHITREFVSAEYISNIMKDVAEDQSVLIYGVKIQSNLRLPDNVEVKKIPKDLLKKCDFESEVR